jgi:hypothetical protein
MSIVAQFKIGKTDYVVVPRAAYLRLGGVPAGSVDAVEFTRDSLGAEMRAARVAAGLSQPDLAKKLRKSQSMIAGVEAGRIAAGARYVAAVLRACKLPKDWKRPASELSR